MCCVAHCTFAAPPLRKKITRSLAISHLSKRFGRQWAVHDLNLEVPNGVILGLLGPNGAGKTTTMRMLTGYLPPTEGEAWVAGQRVDADSVAWKSNLGYLSERNPLPDDLYVREYLAYTARLYRLKENRRCVDRALSLTGLSHMASRKIAVLSKGYRQRVGLAAALIHSPKVLILDEPTNGLDPNQIAEIREVIRTVGSETTVLLSTHIMQEVEALCDSVAIIHSGALVAQGTTAEVLASGSEEAVVVGFATPVDKSRIEALVPGCRVLAQPSGEWLLQGYGGTPDCRAQLVRICSERQLPLSSIYARHSRLEEVFHALTAGNGQPAQKNS